MQQFTPYFPGFDGQQQQNQNQNQQQQPQNNQVQPQPQQPMSLSGANLAIYSPAAMPPLSVLAATQAKLEEQQQQQQQQGLDIGAHGKPKRKQVKNACVNCQKACKKCDVGRPCQRCIKYGLTETCVNSVRKERKKGVKRGPYKKRNKNGGESVTSSGTSTPMPAAAVNPNLYTPPTQTNGSSAPATTSTTSTPNTMPIHYQPFQTTQAYDPYGYNGSNAMMPQAYMVPNSIAQMYPTNPPVLSYQAAMNIISPQQQQQSPVLNNGFRQDQQSSDPNANNSAAATPTNSTPAATDGSIVAKVEEDDDDEGSKLTILSQLCSSVLANNDGTKPADTLEEIKTEETHQNTPPPSRPHSREASHENNNITGTSFTADSTHTYVNSHLSHVTNSNTSAPNSVYGTPGSSPAGSPLQQAQQQPQAQQQ
ncbi:unnamed protein product [Mucor circinelloides]|uniref:Zn(2)-C6 fungal-type domain-containing protein n=1 Tax=Mucor circinelloides f. circinelloides (strain 1006PhL) TaxID=1220926 RepID=S2K0A2_MUCC1|nr:hypothetical protein HMPREF1544_07644 [Mucor circinelloides 1006PhL]